jgi:hypothetical protein
MFSSTQGNVNWQLRQRKDEERLFVTAEKIVGPRSTLRRDTPGYSSVRRFREGVIALTDWAHFI